MTDELDTKEIDLEKLIEIEVRITRCILEGTDEIRRKATHKMFTRMTEFYVLAKHLERENERLREAGERLNKEVSLHTDLICDCHVYPEGTNCSMCQWRDAISKEKPYD